MIYPEDKDDWLNFTSERQKDEISTIYPNNFEKVFSLDLRVVPF